MMGVPALASLALLLVLVLEPSAALRYQGSRRRSVRQDRESRRGTGELRDRFVRRSGLDYARGSGQDNADPFERRSVGRSQRPAPGSGGHKTASELYGSNPIFRDFVGKDIPPPRRFHTGPTGDRFTFMTFASHSNVGSCTTTQIAASRGFPHVVYGNAFTHTEKNVKFMKVYFEYEVARQMNPDDILCFVDGQDVHVQVGPQEMLDRFLAKERSDECGGACVVFGAEFGCWPAVDPTFRSRCPELMRGVCEKGVPRRGKWKHLNSGGYMGRAKHVIPMIQAAMKVMEEKWGGWEGCIDDQAVLSYVYANRPAGAPKIVLDTEIQLIGNLEKSAQDYTLVGGAWKNGHTQTTPAAIHYNGDGKNVMDSWYRALVSNDPGLPRKTLIVDGEEKTIQEVCGEFSTPAGVPVNTNPRMVNQWVLQRPTRGFSDIVATPGGPLSHSSVVAELAAAQELVNPHSVASAAWPETDEALARHLRTAVGRPKRSDSAVRDIFSIKDLYHNGIVALRDHAGFVPRLIVDAGANVGDWTREAKEHFRNAKVFSIEGSNLHQARLTQLYGADNVAIQLLGAETGREVEFFESSNSHTGNSMFREMTDYFKEGSGVVVHRKSLMTLDDLLRSRHQPCPDYIKLDCQGAELEVLKGAAKSLRCASVVLLEISLHPYNKGAPSSSEVFTAMEGYGFKLAGVAEIAQTHGRVGHSQRGIQIQIDGLFVREESDIWANLRVSAGLKT